MKIESAKLKIIQIITNIQSETLVSRILLFVTQFVEKPQTEFKNDQRETYDPLAIARIPTPESVSLEELKKEQGYSIEKMNQHYASLDRSIWQGENLKELLQEL